MTNITDTMTTTSTADSLTLLLRSLKLPTVARLAEEIASKAEKEGFTYGKYLHHLVVLEVHERRRRRIERFQRESDLLPGKTLATLDRAKLPAKVTKMLKSTVVLSGDCPEIWDATMTMKTAELIILKHLGSQRLACATGGRAGTPYGASPEPVGQGSSRSEVP